jgi:hypothetical protein
MNLFGEAIRSEEVKGEDEDGYHIHGISILDLKLKIGKFLHQLIKWDFKNAIWNPDYEQGMELYRLIDKKATKAGYVVDGSWNHGLILGPPYCLTNIYRLRSNLISGSSDKCVVFVM